MVTLSNAFLFSFLLIAKIKDFFFQEKLEGKIMGDISDNLATAATGPKKATGLQGSYEAHSIPDQIAAERFLSAKAATADGKLRGVRFFGIKSPGIM